VHVSGITFTKYTQTIWKPNNINVVVSKKPIGSKHDSQNNNDLNELSIFKTDFNILFMAPTPMTMVQKPLYRNLEIAQNKPSYNRHLTRVLWKDKVGAIYMASTPMTMVQKTLHKPKDCTKQTPIKSWLNSGALIGHTSCSGLSTTCICISNLY
jgi:hypothetical protein